MQSGCICSQVCIAAPIWQVHSLQWRLCCDSACMSLEFCEVTSWHADASCSIHCHMQVVPAHLNPRPWPPGGAGGVWLKGGGVQDICSCFYFLVLTICVRHLCQKLVSLSANLCQHLPTDLKRSSGEWNQAGDDCWKARGRMHCCTCFLRAFWEGFPSSGWPLPAGLLMQACAPMDFCILQEPIWEALSGSQSHNCTGLA